MWGYFVYKSSPFSPNYNFSYLQQDQKKTPHAHKRKKADFPLALVDISSGDKETEHFVELTVVW